MNIKRVVVGILDTNCYILENDKECIIIDPGDETNLIIQNVEKKVVGVVITHYHFDHIGALDDVKNKYNCKVYDVNNLAEGLNNIGSFSFDVIHTPGHKSDLITLYFNDCNCMFCGDFIFEGSIGRTDLDTGDFSVMQKSIKKILNYPKDTIIYPGHGNSTSLKREFNTLSYFMNM